MAKLSINAGATSVTLNVFLQDSSSTVGLGLSGLAYNTSGLKAYYVLPAANSAAITLATQTVTGAWSSGGFVEIDATNCKGLYRFDIPNAAIASGRFSTVYFYGATNLAPCVLEIDLQANVYAINGVAATSVTTINANVGTTQPTNFTGTGSSAYVKSDMVDIAGSAVSTSSAQIGVNVVNAGGTAWGSGAITAASIADGAIDRATFAADTGLQSARSNTAQAGAAGTITLDASASATNDFYKDMYIILTGGTGSGQVRLCTAYNGTTKVATITPNWATNPDNTSTFAVSGSSAADLVAILATAVSTPATAGILDVNVKNMNNVAATSITTINANQGTTQPINYTGTGASALVKSDMVDIAGAAVSTTTAQIGVNAVQINGQTTSASGTVTFPGTVASTTNITAGTITTVTNLTNAPTAGDFTATMKTSLNAATPTVVLSAADSPVIQSGTATAGGASTITIQTALGTTADIIGCLIKITSGTGANQVRMITGYVNGTKVVTVNYAWTTAPDNTSVYAILANNAVKPDSSLKAAGVALVDTLTTYTGNTPQTGDSYARIGTAGVGLTNLGDTRIANLDATVSSRSTLTQTQVTGGAYSVQSASCVLGDARIANLDAAVSTRSTLTQTQVTGGAYSVQSASCVLGDARIANLDATVSSRGTSTLTQTQVTGGAYSVWDVPIASHVTAGTTGEALDNASTAGDPWSTALPGAYGAGTAGKIIGDNLNATVSSRSSQTSVDDLPTNAELATALSAIPTADENADALLGFDWTAATTPASRSVLNALRFIRNKFSTTANPGYVTVYTENDVTEAYTKPITTDPNAEPITNG